MKIKYYYYLEFSHLISIILSYVFKSCDAIYYFDISFTAKSTIRCLRLNLYVKHFKFNLYDLIDEKNYNYYTRYKEDQLEITNLIFEKLIKDNSFTKRICSLFGYKKINLFFQKLIYNDLYVPVIYVYSIIRNNNKKFKDYDVTVNIHVEYKFYNNVIKKYCKQKYGINIKSSITLRQILSYAGIALRYCAEIIFESILACNVVDKHALKVHMVDSIKEKSLPMIGSLYNLRGTTLSLSKRCDFPWLLKSTIPHERVIIYFDRKDAPLTQQMDDILKKNNIKSIAMSHKATSADNAAIYTPSFLFPFRCVYLASLLFLHVCMSLLRGKANCLYFFPQLIRFIREYSHAFYFYKTCNIKINIDFAYYDPFKIARDAALQKSGGISIGYQVPDWACANMFIASSADVLFLFGPHYLPIYRQSKSYNKHFLIAGYITDYSFAEVKTNARSLRDKLKRAGAEFIMTYLDENSSDSSMSLIPNNRSKKIYQRLLRWVIDDPTMGLICSPKRPNTLIERLPDIKDDIEQAEQTGRCVFMRGLYTTEMYPAEVSLASDITICLLFGGTTALEAFLAGSRAVYLDFESLYSFPEYAWGKNTIVFDNIETLCEAIAEFKKDRQSFDYLGNLNNIPNIAGKDPFRDGRAIERMGTYVNDLLELISEGKTSQEAIVCANERYAHVWGSTNIYSTRMN
ncbi:MAG: hypothetical protein ABII23_06960 [bacterium]